MVTQREVVPMCHSHLVVPSFQTVFNCKKGRLVEAGSLAGQPAAVQLSHLLVVMHYLPARLAGNPGFPVDLGGKYPSKRQ